MSYVVTIPVIFPCSRLMVFNALCNLKDYPLWNAGLLKVSDPGPLREGLMYSTEVMVAGQFAQSRIEVKRLIPNEYIELVNTAGSITYREVIALKELGPQKTQVVCTIQFEFKNFVLSMARSTIEALAEARVLGDLEALRALLSAAA